MVGIRDGEIVEQGTHQQLLDQHGFYHHLYMSQFKGEADLNADWHGLLDFTEPESVHGALQAICVIP